MILSVALLTVLIAASIANVSAINCKTKDNVVLLFDGIAQ